MVRSETKLHCFQEIFKVSVSFYFFWQWFVYEKIYSLKAAVLHNQVGNFDR